ncbi:hypothetical protein THRCLA_00008 [Thraustotheca clavata]|uniref:LsmAD domain-containing protein n=1 Tax=Thraustotheca clavata TaxID=74557 RepID=A0A1W0ACN4_9STRA|nr:hypothetical protein THRCLA_00008 [Thraustotheca clavata]
MKGKKLSSASMGSKSSLPPGFKESSAPAPAEQDDQQERVLRHRALYIFRFYVGRTVQVTLRDKSKYTGVLHCIDPDDFTVVVKNTQRLTEDPTKPFNNGSTFVIQHFLLAHISSEGLSDYHQETGATQRLPYNSGTFQTDTDISNNLKAHLFGRELQTASSWLDPSLDTGELERGNNKGNWNQFEVNEKLFGVTSTFDENLYTTKLEKSKITPEQIRAAEQMAREIESQTSSNFHLMEERNLSAERDEIDEETRYSSVVRQGPRSNEKPVAWQRNPNAYVPPALRSKQDSTPKPVSPVAPAPKPVAAPVVEPAKSPKAPSPKKATPPSPKKAESPKKTESPKPKVESPKPTSTKSASPKPASPKPASPKKTEAPKPAAKKGLNPLAKEFKLSAAAAEFTPSKAYTPASVHPPAMHYQGYNDEYYDMEDGDMQGGYVNQYGMPVPIMMPPPVYPPPVYGGNGYHVPPPYHGAPYHPPPYMSDKDNRHNPYGGPPPPPLPR